MKRLILMLLTGACLAVPTCVIPEVIELPCECECDWQDCVDLVIGDDE